MVLPFLTCNSMTELQVLFRCSLNLDCYDVLSLRTFLTLSHSELNFLAFCKRFET